MRVWSQLNIDKGWLKDFDQKCFEKITSVSRQYLGYDLTAIPEHIGKIIICLAVMADKKIEENQIAFLVKSNSLAFISLARQ